ncbi:MAG: glycosyltransferase family 2 protein [Lachnospiraceae bacterium]|nr:glycosyltransferase family 2 protein [Lachnospiraceae bacterium]
MILQELLLRNPDEEGLYFRKQGNIKIEKDKLFFEKNTELLTNTYYNSFSVGKWYRYCDVENITLQICYQGKFRLIIYYAYLEENKLEEIIIKETTIESSSKQMESFMLLKKQEGTVYYRLIALEDDSVIYNAFFDGEVTCEKDIVIALNICTYKREKYLLKNIKLLQDEFLNNADSPLYGHLKVFITDNGSTLEKINDENIFVFENPNLGGAGGFARGLVEIKERKESFGITNAIFMDDDVEIEPEGILRTYRMLKILKGAYSKSFIGGAMLRLDMKYVQHENGALWNAGRCIFVNRGLDLRDFKNVVYNELEQDRDYAAWWYCCIPASMIDSNNLPLPIFIHQDDTEFSLRNAEHIITMNGIAIWHLADEHTRLSTNEYYNLRNMIIVNSKYCKEFGIREIKREVFSRMLVALLRYRYDDMKLIYKAVDDFCHGPKFLLESNATKLHDELRELGYSFEDVSESVKDMNEGDKGAIIVNPFIEKEKRWTLKKVLKLIFILFTANGWILPAKDTEYHHMDVHPAKLFRTGKIVLHNGTGKGIYVKRALRQVFAFVRLYIKARVKLYREYEQAKSKYCAEWKNLCELQSWMKYSDMK